MNCFEVRHHLLTANKKNTLIEKHLHTCRACQQFEQELHIQNSVLKEAINIDVPPHLAERVLLKVQLEKQYSWYRQPFALAASIILAITISFGMWLLPSSPHSVVWHEVILAHVLNERETLDLNKPLAQRQFTQAIASFGLSAKQSVGEIYYVEHCDMPFGKGLHVVLNSPTLGKITLIIPPKHIRASSGFTQREGFYAHMLKHGQQTIGIVSSQSIASKKIQQWLLDNLTLS